MESAAIVAEDKGAYTADRDGIPFEVRLEQPNKETVAAMLEAERIAKAGRWHQSSGYADAEISGAEYAAADLLSEGIAAGCLLPFLQPEIKI